MTKVALLSRLALPVLSAAIGGCSFTPSSGDCSQGPFDVCTNYEGRAIAEIAADDQGGVYSATTSKYGDSLFVITDGMGKVFTVRPRDKNVTERPTKQPEGCITKGLAAHDRDVWIGLSCGTRASVYHAFIDADASTEVLSVENATLTSIQATAVGMVASIASGNEARLYQTSVLGNGAATVLATRPRADVGEKVLVIGNAYTGLTVQWSGASSVPKKSAIYQVPWDDTGKPALATKQHTIYEGSHTIVGFDYFDGRLCVERRNGTSPRNHDIVVVEKDGSLTSLFREDAAAGENSIPARWLTSFGMLYVQDRASEGLDVFETTKRGPTPVMNLEGKRLLGVMSGSPIVQQVAFSVPGERRIRVAEVIRTGESL